MANPPAGVISTSDAPAVQTHEADGVLVITINRPKVATPSTAPPPGPWPRRSTSSTPATTSRSACSPAPAARSAPAWTSRPSRPETRPSSPAADSPA